MMREHSFTPVIRRILSDEFGSVSEINQAIREQAKDQYPVRAIIKRYMECIEEIINTPILIARLQKVVQAGGLNTVIEEIVKHSRVEFNLAV